MNSNYVVEIQSTCTSKEQLVAGQHVSVNVSGYKLLVRLYDRTVRRIQLLRRDTPDFIVPDLWPPNSPDLNPVEYITQQRVYESRINNVDELKQRLIDVWSELQQMSRTLLILLSASAGESGRELVFAHITVDILNITCIDCRLSEETSIFSGLSVLIGV